MNQIRLNYFNILRTWGARKRMAKVTKTKAIAQLRIQTNMKFGLKPRFTTTITNETKNVAIKLIITANFTSVFDGLLMLLFTLFLNTN